MEIDARAPVQLIDDDAFCAVDNEFAAAEHDRQNAEIDVFLNGGVFGDESEPHAPRSSVGKAQLSTFVRTILRLFKLISEIFESYGIVAAPLLDRKRFAKQSF